MNWLFIQFVVITFIASFALSDRKRSAKRRKRTSADVQDSIDGANGGVDGIGFGASSIGLDEPFLTHSRIATKKRNRPTNILLILADDLGFGDTSVPPFVGTGILTPQLRKMAARGVVMTNFHSAAAICTPTRASLLTGMYPWRMGIKAVFEYGDHGNKSNRNDWLIQVPTAPMVFSEAGYNTFHSGKWHVGGMRNDDLDMRLLPRPEGEAVGGRRCPHPGPQQQGFQHYVSVLDGPGSPRQNTLQTESKLYSHGCQHLLEDDHNLSQEKYNISGYLSYCEAKHAMRAISRSVTENQPFYIHLWFHAPHGPWQEVPGYNDWYPKQRYPRQEGDIPTCSAPNSKEFRYCYATGGGGGKKGEGGGSKRRIVDRGMQRMFQYRTMVSDMDNQIGMVLDHIDKLNIARDTLVVFTSDNGPEDGAGRAGIFRANKRFLYEGGVRVPAIAQWPGTIPANSVTSTMMISTDLFPTFLEAAGLTLPKHMRIDGISILPDLLLASRIGGNQVYETLFGANSTKTISSSSSSSSSHANISISNGKIDMSSYLIAPLEPKLNSPKRRAQRRQQMQERLLLWHHDFEGPRRVAAVFYGYKFILDEAEVPMEVFDLFADPKEERNLLPGDSKYWKKFAIDFPSVSPVGFVSSSFKLTRNHLFDLRDHPNVIYRLMMRVFAAMRSYAQRGANGYHNYLTRWPQLRYNPTPPSNERHVITNIYKKISREQMPNFIRDFLTKGTCGKAPCNCSVPMASNIPTLPFDPIDPRDAASVVTMPFPFVNATMILGL